MKKLKEKINNIIERSKRVLTFLFIIGISLLIMKSFYDLFNPKGDAAFETKIREETNAKEVRFDSKVLKNIVEKDGQGVQIPIQTSGKNPFIVY